MTYFLRSLARPLAVLSLILAAASNASAQPAVMTFASTACTGPDFNASIPDPYFEAGYRLVVLNGYGFGAYCAENPSYAGPGMFINATNTTGSLTKSDAGAFSINGIELTHANAGTVDPQSFTFIGNLAGGGTVSQTFTIPAQDGPNVFTPFVFDATWTNLASVVFPGENDNTGYYQFTNVLLDSATAVPEPASLALLGTGLFGLAPMVRRKLRK